VAVFLDNKCVTGNFKAVEHKLEPERKVAGWVNPDEIAALMAEVAAYKA